MAKNLERALNKAHERYLEAFWSNCSPDILGKARKEYLELAEEYKKEFRNSLKKKYGGKRNENN